ncbi:glycosyltransferase [Formicincola oecophyllae]|uniref:Glycosyltransferase n=1 Tax=Formicincola oecophyllae TaxID=2558361 RepID=A0A4Y6U9J6_9PROT|nr:bacteriohopanetetrol glucosamine biosynthesis glycosyltransferase HpnI [Formicincola oecophyllae]QDH13700.1 glycosyltransferase [Formicincola oecophyllae]
MSLTTHSKGAALRSAASLFCGLLAGTGLVQAMLGLRALRRFKRQAGTAAPPLAGRAAPFSTEEPTWPSVSLFKPVCGEEPLLEEALESFFKLAYPGTHELVFGLHSADDKALPVIKALIARHPEVEARLVIDATLHGSNRKVSNLINMASHAQYDVWVVADSDIHVEESYLTKVVKPLGDPGTGLVTALYTGLPASNTLVRQMGAYQINASFLPGALMARQMGRQDSFGATVALHRQTLAQLGGFEALANQVADDALLGALTRRHGLAVALAPTLCQTTISETSLAALLSHELRWGRTTRKVAPVGYALSILQYPLFWAVGAILLRPASTPAWGLLGGGWLARLVMNRFLGQETGIDLTGLDFFLPLRDCLSAGIVLASLTGRRVTWRGHTLQLTDGPFPTSGPHH